MKNISRAILESHRMGSWPEVKENSTLDGRYEVRRLIWDEIEVALNLTQWSFSVNSTWLGNIK